MSVGLRPQYISLFSGGLGLDLGIELALRSARGVCYVEREAFAVAALVAKMEAATVAKAPIWTDVSTFDGRPWRGVVDLVIGGFPCQDISNAGKRKGLAGERSGLWFEYARIVSEVRPRFIFIENVAAFRSRGLDVVLGSLASLGYDAAWGCFRASDVGAPHKRERVFILAHAVGESLRIESGRGSGTSRAGSLLAGFAGEELAHADGSRLERRGKPVDERADEVTPWAPGPEEFDRWRALLQLRPDLEPSICREAHGVADTLVDRIDRLRLLGNGVVPQVAALAFVTLYRMLTDG